MLKNCEGCNRVFAHPARTLCQDCYEKSQKWFTSVKDYLQANQGASVAEVARETEVDIELIYEYIRAGRLNVVPKDARLFCSICGDLINAGRLCAKCRTGLQKSNYEEPKSVEKPQNTGSRVHYLNQIKDRR